MNTYPFISIITAVYNWAKHIEETIQNIINQDYPNFEFVIIDGWSTDGTIDIIKKYEDKITYWISEKDKWISDAFNKWVLASKWDYINFQWDGDWFCTTSSLSETFKNIDPSKDIFVSAKIQRIDENGNEIFVSKQKKYFNKRDLLFRMNMPHQWLFTHKSYFERYGLFDVDNAFCMDYEHLLRAYQDFPRVVIKDVIVARWRADWLGNGKVLEILQEYDAIKRKNKVAPGFILDLINIWSIFKYYISKIIRHEYWK